LKQFIQGLFNEKVEKTVSDKDMELFIGFLDLDRNNFVSRDEFDRGMKKVDLIYKAHKS